MENIRTTFTTEVGKNNAANASEHFITQLGNDNGFRETRGTVEAVVGTVVTGIGLFNGQIELGALDVTTKGLQRREEASGIGAVLLSDSPAKVREGIRNYQLASVISSLPVAAMLVIGVGGFIGVGGAIAFGAIKYFTGRAVQKQMEAYADHLEGNTRTASERYLEVHSVRNLPMYGARFEEITRYLLALGYGMNTIITLLSGNLIGFALNGITTAFEARTAQMAGNTVKFYDALNTSLQKHQEREATESRSTKWFGWIDGLRYA